MSVTVLELASHRLQRPASNGADFEEAELPIMGGCQGCGASIAAYNAYPSQTGFLRCRRCIFDAGFETVQDAESAIFGETRPIRMRRRFV